VNDGKTGKREKIKRSTKKTKQELSRVLPASGETTVAAEAFQKLNENKKGAHS
jgi:hypothetical protein